MSKFPHGKKQVLEFYGNPVTSKGELNTDWYLRNIVRMPLPAGMDMVLAWDTTKHIKSMLVHRKCADSLQRCLQRVWNHLRVVAKTKWWGTPVPSNLTETQFWDLKTNQLLAESGLNQFGGTFNFRKIRGSKMLSFHALGAAIDLDPAHNPLGAAKGRMPQWVVDIFEDEGWNWGGNFKKRKDLMHFEAGSY